MSESIFEPHTLEEHTDSLSAFLPGGCLFEAKDIAGTNLRKTLTGLSGELKRMEDALIQFTSEYDPSKTTSFITEWERMVGIPDACFDTSGTIEERRKHIVAKSFKSLGVATEQDFIDLAAFLGFTITIEHPEEFLLPYDVPFTPEVGLPRSRFVMIINGSGISENNPPYDVPFIPGGGSNILTCLFDKLKPANTLIIYNP
jgi:uncharacterized protein YmfQ (DUF2313 family)